MSLILRQLQLRVVTKKGLFGITIPFAKGLVVLRAENSMGKSTCLQAIIYALGLEGMLSAAHDVPLPHVMTDSIDDDEDHRYPVLESSVLLEFENGSGGVMTAQRTVKHADRDTKLISTWNGPKLTDPEGAYRQKDFYVRMEGAAQRLDGFHNHLAGFLGWSLPQVPRFDGSDVPLYLECIFPLFFVEQKHGWAGIQARMPTWFRIKEVAKRATEFVLRLDAYQNAVRRETLREESVELRNEWHAVVAEFTGVVQTFGGMLQGIPPQPIAEWPPPVPPQILLPDGKQWRSLEQALSEDRGNLKRLQAEEIPRVEQVAQELTVALKQSEEALAQTERTAARMFEEVESERSQIGAIDQRLLALQEDLQRNRDSVRLRNLGSIATLKVVSGICPTCQQPVTDTLLSQGQGPEPMSLDENIAFIGSQLQTFQSMREESRRVLGAKEHRLTAIRSRAETLRDEIRSQKRALVSDGRVPSAAAIREQMRLEDRVRLLGRLQEKFAGAGQRLSQISGRWRDVQEKLADLPKGDLSPRDEEKLRALQRIFVDQARLFHLKSVPPESLKISPETYRPSHDGFDLGFDLSASDMIRTIWAYLHGLLELARQTESNHPNLLILDEPQQHQMKELSFAEFLKRASTAGGAGQQVIFATSADEEALKGMLSGMPHTYTSFAGRMLKAIPS